MRRPGRLPALFVSALMSAPALGHHSIAMFDFRSTIELDGTLTAVNWRNPHVMLELATVDSGGHETIWTLETSSPSLLRRANVGAESIAAGDTVRVAGHPAVDGSREMFATHLLRPAGDEIVLVGDTPRFTQRVYGTPSSWQEKPIDVSQPEVGIFRVWSSGENSALRPLDAALTADIFRAKLLTPAAREAERRFDPVATSRSEDCTPKGMPRIMEQPYDMAFVRDGNDIRLLIEEYDTVRLIHMTSVPRPPGVAVSSLGYSTGRWDGTALVVETARIAGGRLFALELSDRVTTVERFAPSADGGRLDYRLSIADPAVFVEPLELTKTWTAFGDQTIDRYDCDAARYADTPKR